MSNASRGALPEGAHGVAVALGVTRFYLVGHSMSGEVLTENAAAYPDKVAGLVYVDTVGDFRACRRRRSRKRCGRRRRPALGILSAIEPSVERVTIPGVSHWLMMDDPEAFNRALDPFISFSARP